jgi:hypothetical protein
VSSPSLWLHRAACLHGAGIPQGQSQSVLTTGHQPPLMPWHGTCTVVLLVVLQILHQGACRVWMARLCLLQARNANTHRVQLYSWHFPSTAAKRCHLVALAVHILIAAAQGLRHMPRSHVQQKYSCKEKRIPAASAQLVVLFQLNLTLQTERPSFMWSMHCSRAA